MATLKQTTIILFALLTLGFSCCGSKNEPSQDEDSIIGLNIL